jgi:hypothetical protein
MKVTRIAPNGMRITVNSNKDSDKIAKRLKEVWDGKDRTKAAVKILPKADRP